MQIDELTDKFFAWNIRNRAPATVAFYRARLKKFREAYNARDMASLTPLEIDEHLAAAGTGMSDSTRHHDVVALERLQKFAVQNKLLEKPVFGKLEKPRVGRRDRIPTLAWTEAILMRASPAFRLIYCALRQCGARPGELCRAAIADVDRTTRRFFVLGSEYCVLPTDYCQLTTAKIATNAARRFAARKGSNSPAGCWGTQTSVRPSGTCTLTTMSWRMRRI